MFFLSTELQALYLAEFKTVSTDIAGRKDLGWRSGNYNSEMVWCIHYVMSHTVRQNMLSLRFMSSVELYHHWVLITTAAKRFYFLKSIFVNLRYIFTCHSNFTHWLFCYFTKQRLVLKDLNPTKPYALLYVHILGSCWLFQMNYVSL